jgi:ankyrin repeat protein
VHKRKNVLNKVDKTGTSVLDRAYLLPVEEADREKIIHFLKSQGAEILGYKALNHFIERGSLSVVETLCRHCTDFSAHNKSGKTILMVAAESGHMDIVRYLVEKIAVNPGEKNDEGETAADFAKIMGHKEVYEYLKHKILDAL